MTLSKQYYKDFAFILAKKNASDELIRAFEQYFILDNERFSVSKFNEFIRRIRTNGNTIN